ncbi:uncharacterized protein LOC113757848 [Coffea eugenioides]|uniref:uncharacterized protein LOC113757848 n=1 Tax=Coffea eugenioides TaxID=49369 RepID=UPI000F6112D9|nr:uncharacterized protein LOC113757848 [Coffea eugenioides]
MDGRRSGRGHGRGSRQAQPHGDDQGSAIGPTQGQGNLEGNQVTTAINRMTDILEWLAERQGPRPLNQPRGQDRREDRALERFPKFNRLSSRESPTLRQRRIENDCWRKSGKSLFCGYIEHQLANCPSKLKVGGSTQRPEKSTFKQTSAGGSQPKVPARVYALDYQQIPDSTEVVEGATHSFVNPKFISGIDLKPIKLHYDLEVRTPTGDQSLLANLVYKDCEISVGERKLLADQIGLAIKGYEVILGMDWLARYNAQFNWIRARKMLSKGAQGYLAFLINNPRDKVKLEGMPVVKEYPDVFPEELVFIPRKRHNF